MGERVKARAMVVRPPDGTLYARGARILDGDYAGALFALDGWAAFGEFRDVEFAPEDQWAHLVH